MTDTGPLEPKVSIWVQAFYTAKSWTWDMMPQILPKGMSQAAKDLLGKLNPRPANTEAPKGASETEVKDIETAYQQLLSDIGDCTSEDVTALKKKLTDLENLVTKTAQDVTARVKDARKKVLEDLAKVPVALGAPDRDLRLQSQRRTELAKEIASADTEALLESLAKTVAAFDTGSKEVIAMIAPRNAVQEDLAKFRSELKALAQVLDRGFFEALSKTADEAQKSIDNALDKNALDAVTKTLSEQRGKVADAKTYAADYEKWAREAEIFIACATLTPPDDKDLPKLRIDLAAAAANLTRKGDFAGARKELAKFADNATVKGGAAGDFGKMVEFSTKLARIVDGPEIPFNKVAKPGGWNVVDTELANARKKGLKDKDFTAAIGMLDTLITKIEGQYSVAKKIDQYSPIAGTANNDPVKMVINAANAKCLAGSYGDAVNDFNGLDGTVKDKSATKSRIDNMKKKAQPLATPEATAHAYVTGLIGLAQTEYDKPDYTEANKLLDTAGKELDTVITWAALAAEARVAKTAQDSADAYKLLDVANDHATKNKYEDAAKELKTAIAGYAAIAGYKAIRAQIEFLYAALDATTDDAKAVKKVLDDANDLAVTQKKVKEAQDLLATVLAMPALSEAATEAAEWLKALTPVKTRHAAIIGTVAPPAAQKTVAESLTAAEDKATKNKDIPGAVKLLEAHAALLTDTRDFLALRKRTTEVKAALDRAVKDFAGDPTAVDAIYGAKDDTKLKQAMDKCDDLAVKGDVSGGAKAYGQLLKDWKGLISAAAKMHEKTDGTGSNAGHSLDRHGPEVDDDKLLRRLVTGIAPDNKESTTKKSSRFDNFESWLQAREESAKFAETKETYPGSGTKISVADKSIPAEDTAEIRIECEIDHGGPIDKAFVGVKPEIGVNAQEGKLTKGDTFETYETLTGISKSKALWLFEIDFSALIIPPTYPDLPDRQPKTPKGYKDLWAIRRRPDPVPGTIPGKWVMMQLFPLVDGWDQETQTYK